jgi:5-methylcytosine-specific restriction endonuclease McrA
MTGRKIKEWIGATPDTPAPPRVRLRVFEAFGGKCGITGRRINAGDAWDLDHILALTNGGENRESNLQPALKDAHKAKTARDVAQKSKDRRVRQKHLGIHKPKNPLPGGKNSDWKQKVGGGWVRRDED